MPWTTLSDEQFKYMMGTYRETIKEKYFPDNEECLGEMFENKCFLDEVLGFCSTQKQRDMVVNKALKID